MKDQSRAVYRHAARAEVIRRDGTAEQARGLVVRLWGRAEDLGPGVRHPSGRLEDPLYVFTGWTGDVEPGDALKQEDGLYTILKVDGLAVGGLRVATRLLLERRVAEHDGP